MTLLCTESCITLCILILLHMTIGKNKPRAFSIVKLSRLVKYLQEFSILHSMVRFSSLKNFLVTYTLVWWWENCISLNAAINVITPFSSWLTMGLKKYFTKTNTLAYFASVLMLMKKLYNINCRFQYCQTLLFIADFGTK